MTMGLPCCTDSTVAMGSAVYGTPHTMSNSTDLSVDHIALATA
jgi:hypothetical protein